MIEEWLVILLRVAVFVIGLLLVFATVTGAIRTFVLPRAAADVLTRFVFRGMRFVFNLRVKTATTYAQRDRIMAMYAPLTLMLLPAVWLGSIALGYTAMFWAIGTGSWLDAFRMSGSSLLTLGIKSGDSLSGSLLMFSEATLGLMLVALLISYLPTIYAAFSRRESAVTMLEVRAGSPPSALTMILRYHRLKRLAKLNELWYTWEQWFSELEETHSSLAVLSFFRSPHPDRSWITAAGTILDTAALAVSTLDIPHDVQADICIRAGFIALRHIADFFNIPYDPDPHPGDPISISREEYDALVDEIASEGISIKADRDQSWKDYAGWRVNYDSVLLGLAALVMAPYAPWVSDRSSIYSIDLHKHRKDRAEK